MTAQEFCYWLRGFLEMGDPKDMTEAQVKMLKKHLELVFVDVTSEQDVSVAEGPCSDEPEEPSDKEKGITAFLKRRRNLRPDVTCGGSTFDFTGVKYC